MKEWYRNFNILPIVLVYNYSEEDFKNLLEFIQFVETFSSKLNLSYLYYLQEKSWHFEFTIDPNWDILWDNMWTAEEFFKLKQRKDKIIWKIWEVLLEDIESGLSSYSYIDYLKNITESEKSKQSYTNLLKLSNLLKKYDKKISIRNRIY
jgi:transcription initiation factor TFIIIB Brf1 subunit/transcription initiation factor TFIIB